MSCKVLTKVTSTTSLFATKQVHTGSLSGKQTFSLQQWIRAGEANYYGWEQTGKRSEAAKLTQNEGEGVYPPLLYLSVFSVPLW
jgi:hypothetical protein